jgi:transposase
VPGLTRGESRRLCLLQRKLARAKRGSNRRGRVKAAIARLKAREVDRRTGWVEQTSARLARDFDVIGVEDLNICGMTRTAKGTLEHPGNRVVQKAGLNRGILAAGWGRLVERLEYKAPGRVIKINPAYTSQTCSVCGMREAAARKSRAVFACRSCGYTGHADVNAARNIKLQAQHAWTAAGRAVAARGGPGLPGPANREPQHVLLSA